MVLSSNNSLIFFSDFEIIFFFALESFHTFDIFRPNPRYSIFFLFSKCLSSNDFLGGGSEESSKNEKKKENGQKDSVSGSNREKIKMGSHAPPIQFLRRRNPNQKIYMATKRPNQTIRNMYSARIQLQTQPPPRPKT